MIFLLTVALSTVSLLLLLSAFGHGREWWGAMDAKRQLRQALADRDEWKYVSNKQTEEITKLVGLLAESEKKRAEALARVGVQAEGITFMESEINKLRDVNGELLAAQSAFEREVQSLGLRCEMVVKESQEKQRTAAILQATSNERIDELTATVTKKNGTIREAISKLQHAVA